MPQQNVLYPQDVFHVKLKISGSPEKQALFHFILEDLDADWPYKAGVLEDGVCKVCDGGVYVNPKFGVQDLRALAKQIDKLGKLPGGLKVKIRQFRKESACGKIYTSKIEGYAG